ncbi:MAG: PKD domain-containing protein [Paludibacteraceae bacterium]|nr:PKD domain-containing protein [Paludibacteraceae bacterium]
MKRDFLKMLLIALLPLCAVSCIENVPEEEVLPRDAVSFEYYIDQEADPKYYLDFYVDSDITFKNTSPQTTQGEPVWDFGDGETAQGDQVTHFYAKGGTYKVTLTIGDFKKVQSIMIAPIKPIVKVVTSDEICEVRSTLVTFDIELPNPKNKPATFTWILPMDTKNASDESVDSIVFETSFVGADTIIPVPKDLKLWHVGSQQVQLEVKLGDEDLDPTLLNVQVAYNNPVPTLYYAVVGGSIMAHKLTGADVDSTMIINSYNLGVASGQHPFNILFHDTLLYVLDAGKQFYYVNDVNGVLGDGKISVLSKDGSKVQTMITNAGQAAFDDPFYGFIDGDFLYYANRNTGIMKVPLKDRDKVYNITDYPYYVRHNHLQYYGPKLAYGAVSRNFAKIDGVWHWSTCHTSTATFCFTDEDILKEPVTQGDKDKLPEEGVILEGLKIGSFYYSKKHDKVVFCAMGTTANCVAVCTYAEWKEFLSQGEVAKKSIKFEEKDFASDLSGTLYSKEGTGVECVGITQIAYDEVNECVYFAYRNPKKAENNPVSGIYCYNLVSGEVTQLIANVEAYGLSVNNTPSKLF